MFKWFLFTMVLWFATIHIVADVFIDLRDPVKCKKHLQIFFQTISPNIKTYIKNKSMPNGNYSKNVLNNIVNTILLCFAVHDQQTYIKRNKINMYRVRKID